MTDDRIRWLAIPTRGRPVLLARALKATPRTSRSMAALWTSWSQTIRTDQATGKESSGCSELSRNATGSVWYVGAREKQACTNG